MLVTGPALWEKLHRWALNTPLIPAAVDAWLSNFVRSIPCGDCQQDFMGMGRKTPPPLTSNDALFAWTVRLHNNVNAKLGKPTVSVVEALEKWGEKSGCCRGKEGKACARASRE